jgi:hypothetical protein
MHTDSLDSVRTGHAGMNADGPDTQPATHHIPEASAYLIVHVEPDALHRPDGHAVTTRLQRLRALYGGSHHPERRAPLALTLTDHQGQQLLSLAEAEPTLGIALPPGTYHLTATRGTSRRGYTVSLPAGARFDLHLRFSATDDPPHHAAIPPSDPRPLRSAH